MQKDPYHLVDLLKPSVNELGFELWGIEFHANTKNAVLRIYIDHENGIDIENCVEVSHQVAGLLDVHDPIKTHYTLEVSSPGLDRLFFYPEQFKKYLGERVKFQLNTLIDARRRLEGKIIEVTSEGVLIELPSKKNNKSEQPLEAQKVLVLFDWIDRANLVSTF